MLFKNKLNNKSIWCTFTFTFHQDLSRAFSTIDNDLVDSLIIQLSRVNVKAVDAAIRCESDASWGSDRFVILEPLGRFVRAADLTLQVQLLFLIDCDIGQGSYEGCWKFCGQSVGRETTNKAKMPIIIMYRMNNKREEVYCKQLQLPEHIW